MTTTTTTMTMTDTILTVAADVVNGQNDHFVRCPAALHTTQSRAPRFHLLSSLSDPIGLLFALPCHNEKNRSALSLFVLLRKESTKLRYRLYSIF